MLKRIPGMGMRMREKLISEENYVFRDIGKSWHGISFVSFTFPIEKGKEKRQRKMKRKKKRRRRRKR